MLLDASLASAEWVARYIGETVASRAGLERIASVA
jgi:hypothetical protein